MEPIINFWPLVAILLACHFLGLALYVLRRRLVRTRFRMWNTRFGLYSEILYSSKLADIATGQGSQLAALQRQLYECQMASIQPKPLARKQARHPDYCRVAVEGGKHFVLMPDGQRIPAQTCSVVYQDMDESFAGMCRVRLTLLATLDTTQNSDAQ